MNKGKEHSNFYTLQQDGLFAAPDHIDFSQAFNPAIRKASSRERTQYSAVRDEIFNMLGVESYKEIDALRQDPQRIQEASDRAYASIGRLYGIEGSLSEIKTEVGRYAENADEVIDYLRDNIFNGLSVRVEMINEVQATNNPVKLLLIACDEGYHPKPRFEAIRKLELMKLSAAIHQRERESGVSDKFAQFIGFMNENVWSKAKRIGEVEEVTLLSTHDPDTYEATSVRVLDTDAKPSVYEKSTNLSRRSFEHNGHEIPIYVTIRQKPDVAKILKLLRKNDQNPATAVDDELGVMLVFNSTQDIKLFTKHLSQSAGKAGSQMTIEEISDTLNGESYDNKNAGSSNGIQMLKFFARMEGARVEFVLHTNETYVNQLYKRGVSHAEYEANRIFDSGVADLLFPQSFFEIDLKKAQEEVIKKRRAKIENR